MWGGAAIVIMRRAGFAKETNELAMIVRTSVSRGIFVLAYLGIYILVTRCNAVHTISNGNSPS